MSHLLRAGSRLIPYDIAFADTRRLSISVYPDLSVRVRAPSTADRSSLEQRLRDRVPWILKQIRHFERYHPLPAPRQYVSGETHLYLGRQYRLRVRRGAEGVRLNRPFLLITHPERPRPALVAQMLKAWYWSRASWLFPRRLEKTIERVPWLDREAPPLRIRDMMTRWGSCGPSGVISLSVELVKAPIPCIDYVVAHELCHRLELSHSRRFYQLLSRAMPEWERARERLNRALR